MKRKIKKGENEYKLKTRKIKITKGKTVKFHNSFEKQRKSMLLYLNTRSH